MTDLNPIRELYKWKIAHILLDAAGTYMCLDINVTGLNLTEIKNNIIEFANKSKPNDSMPSVSKEIWNRYVAATLDKSQQMTMTELYEFGFTRSKYLLLIVRKET